MRRKMIIALLVFLVISVAGCAKLRNSWASEGGFWASMFGGTQGDYIVISQSGGLIMDIWKLRNAIVQSASSSDGWLFRDNNRNAVNVAGDIKVLRIINNDEIWEKYHEYHMEFEGQSYRTKFTEE